MPHLERLRKAYAARGVEVITLSRDEAADLKKFLAGHPVATEMAYFSEKNHRAFLADAESTPLTFVIDRQGVVREFILGAGGYGRFEDLIREYL